MNLHFRNEGDTTEVVAMVRGLCTVALVDGMHDREVRLISDFLHGRLSTSAPGDGIETASSLARFTSIEPHALASHLIHAGQGERFLTTAYLLAWADGKVSFEERACIDAFAAALAVGSDALARMEGEVKEHLLRNAPLSGSLAQVSLA